MRLQSILSITAFALVLPFASAHAGTWPAGTEKTFVSQCETAAKQNLGDAPNASKIATEHCTCSSKAIGKKLSDADLKALTGTTQPTEELKGRMMAAVSECQGQK
jgi:hypothetical protein